MKPSPRDEIVARAESFPGIKAGIARLEDVLRAPSYEGVLDESFASPLAHDVGAPAVLVLGLHHPEDDPRLDWWDEDGCPGDRRLVAVCESLARWLEAEHGIGALTLTYQPGEGGVFLKDAAVLAGLGVIGRNNLLVNPEWGPRIRFRALLIDADLEPTGRLEGFSPCESCPLLCHRACPRDALAVGAYQRPPCGEQMSADVANRMPDGEAEEDGSPRLVIKYCRACELACPVGA